MAIYPARGFTSDIQVDDGKLYSAENFAGLACYRRDASKLVYLDSYRSDKALKQIRLSGDGRFIVAHAGGSGFAFLEVAGGSRIRLVKMESAKGGGLVYFRQLCNGFIEGKYICGYRNGGEAFMADFSGPAPEPMPDVEGLKVGMMNGFAPCGEYVLATHRGGYVFYKPGTQGSADALPVHRIKDGPQIWGKPTVKGRLLTACNRFTGDVFIADISDLTAPRLIRQFNISGSPDCAFIADDHILIPAGYQGLLKFDCTN